jgi:hypothetical protein
VFWRSNSVWLRGSAVHLCLPGSMTSVIESRWGQAGNSRPHDQAQMCTGGPASSHLAAYSALGSLLSRSLSCACFAASTRCCSSPFLYSRAQSGMAPSPHVLHFPALSLSLSYVTPLSRTTPLHVHVLDHLHVCVHVTNTNTLLHVSLRTTSSTKPGFNPKHWALHVTLRKSANLPSSLPSHFSPQNHPQACKKASPALQHRLTGSADITAGGQRSMY